MVQIKKETQNICMVIFGFFKKRFEPKLSRYQEVVLSTITIKVETSWTVKEYEIFLYPYCDDIMLARWLVTYF